MNHFLSIDLINAFIYILLSQQTGYELLLLIILKAK
jgi:hypothetical protein